MQDAAVEARVRAQCQRYGVRFDIRHGVASKPDPMISSSSTTFDVHHDRPQELRQVAAPSLAPKYPLSASGSLSSFVSYTSTSASPTHVLSPASVPSLQFGRHLLHNCDHLYAPLTASAGSCRRPGSS